MRRSFAPARIKSSADRAGRGGVLSWAPKVRGVFATQSPQRTVLVLVLSSSGSVGVIFLGPMVCLEEGVASRGVRSCVSGVLDGGVLGRIRRPLSPYSRVGSTPLRGWGEGVVWFVTDETVP